MADLNITYNYGHYYHEIYKEDGIRAIYGVLGFDSILMLEKMIAFLNKKYMKNGEWIRTKRKRIIYYDKNGNEIESIVALLNKITPAREEVEFEVSEGDTSDYWMDTAANAIKPLYQLIALAKMRPDCIWDGD